MEREAREGLEERLRARGLRGEGPRAVVQEAFATFVRELTSNPDLDEEVFDEIFCDIFAGIANEYVLEDARGGDVRRLRQRRCTSPRKPRG